LSESRASSHPRSLSRLQTLTSEEYSNMSHANQLVNILVRRDAISEDEAVEIVDDARNRVILGENPEELLWEMGLEPDYVFDLL
jgi:hypothetical protein